MNVDEKGIALLKQLEGLRLTAYRCSADRLTIGYGHTSGAGAPIVVPGMKITDAEADRILRRDIAYFEAEVARLVKVALNVCQWNAVVSFAYNVGIPAFEGSTLLKKINDSRFAEVPAEMMKWSKFHDPKTKKIATLPGLLIRRRAETAMWRSLDEIKTDVAEGDTRQQPVAPLPIRAAYQSKEATTSVATSVAGALLIAHEMKDQIESAEDLISAFKASAHDPNFVFAAVVVLACLAVYYWRTKRLREEETE